MTISISIILLIIVGLMIAKWDLSWFKALVCVLAGLTLGGTEVGDWLLKFLDELGTAVSQIKF